MRIAVVLGTRPEAIKLSPVIAVLRGTPGIETVVVSTGQHRVMLDQALQWFGIHPDVDLELMRTSQGPGEFLGRAVAALETTLSSLDTKAVLVQGDTTTALAGALAGFYRHIAVGHVEAGLRTYDLKAPFPEEANRAMISRIATWNFAPTERSVQALLSERVPGITLLTGNTIVDAVLMTAKSAESALAPADGRPLVLITGHRRENMGAGFEAVFDAISDLAEHNPTVSFVYPVHLNPEVREPALRRLAGRPNLRLTPPLPYPEMVALMRRATLILTDSGGIQEEAPTFAVPVLIMRDKTERPEAVESGFAALVGTERDRIVREVQALLDDPERGARISGKPNPFGDGFASVRIVEHVRKALSGRYGP